MDRDFERLYRRHALDVYRYAYAVLRNQADAEDVAQTTFLNAYRAIERGDRPQTPHNWLIAIAHNVCRQRFRQQSRRVQEVGLDLDVADVLVGAEDDDTPTPADIKRALGHLAFNQRAALVMRELEGRSYAEIADLLGLSVSAVETLLFRARRALREQLDGSITCGQAELYLSRRLDSELSRGDRSHLRAHLRECTACQKLARSQRAQRAALKALGAVPLPSSLASLFGGGGGAVAAKVAVVVVATGVAGGLGYDTHHQLRQPPKPQPQPVVQSVAPATPAADAVVARQVHRHVAPTQPRKPAVRGPKRVVHAPRGHERPRTVSPAAAAVRHGRGRAVGHAKHPQRPVAAVTFGRDGKAGHGHAARPRPPQAAHAHAPKPHPAHSSARAPAQPDQAAAAPQNGNGNGKPHDLMPAPAPMPQLPVDPGLTDTSQNDGARNDVVGHLVP